MGYQRRVHGDTQQANMLQKTLLLCALAVAYATATPLLSTGKNIVELAVATPELSTLVTALKAGALVDTLSGEGPFTVFAPTNEAFAKLSASILAHLLEPANVKELDAVLEYHVVSGAAVFSNYLTDGEKIKTVEGQNVTVSIYNGRVFINNALVTTADVAASNGVIHIIDTVLNMPPAPAPPASKNIVELAIATPDFSTLVTALKAGGLVDTLSTDGPFTVFAPTNEAFAKLPAATLTHLLDPANVKELDALLEYHVVAGVAAFVKDLKDEELLQTVEGQNVSIRVNPYGPDESAVVINIGSTVIYADIAASNGVIHGIDTVLTIPPCPTPAPNMTIVEVAETFDEPSTLVTALKAADLEQALAGPTLTIFAPTNQAFERLPKATLAHLLDPANIKELVALLEYHVLSEQASAEQIIKFSKKYSVITTLEGRTVNVRTLPPNSLDETILVINDAFVTTADIRASNGFIHIIDTVLTVPKPDPKKATICDVVAANPDLSTLNTALKAAEFNYLCETSAPQDPDTFLAPSNAAFDRLPKATLAHLLDPANAGELATLLEYHVAPGLLPNPIAYYSKDLTNGEEIPSLPVRKLPAEGNGDKVTVTIDPSKNILINDAFVTTADIGAYNGIIHIIDTVLTLPTQPAKTVTDVAAATPEFATLVTPV